MPANEVDDAPSQESIMVKNEELENRRQALVQALSGLNVRERRIFEARRLAEDPIPLGVLALESGVSGERVRQIEARAFEKVQKAVQRRVAAIEQPERRHQFHMKLSSPRDPTRSTGNKSPAAAVSL